ncbi:hypothetical protein JHK82_013315 [Glycine max]|uniref:Uncharacterized protein n=2 Tax=Glycine subgen. Soja TaxID=1462606 RepID=A0A0R0JXK5_SOYBN|nr:hypothetical protein JHK85_013684 [Glycine max]KAG5155346.1 hypothetical protein JHK82_013315 [Glycine max]KAH1135057.1 hypothetical protein GYH30_013055 [Glycine max]RZC13035.1 hypothetical protein D0Y65_012662 [Glycine soja]
MDLSAHHLFSNEHFTRCPEVVTASTTRLVSSSPAKPTFLWHHQSCHVPPPSPAIFFNLFTFCQIYSSPVQSRCTSSAI